MKKGGYFTDYSILGRSPLFRGIPAGDFGVLLEHLKAETRSYKKGDLICFYSDNYSKIGHIGIVISSSMMIDASSSNGKVVRREYKTTYWKKHFYCGRRPW